MKKDIGRVGNRKLFNKIMLCLGAVGISAAALAAGLSFFNPAPNSFIDDYGNATIIDEIWSDSYFDKSNLQRLLDTISGIKNVDFGVLRSMATAERTDENAICLKVGTSAEGMRQNNKGEEIIVRMGGLDWSPTYLSTDKDGNTILTLWLTNSSQLNGKNITSSTKFDSVGTSKWSQMGWGYEDYLKDPYPTLMYGTSYIRSVVLNNGGKYATSGTETKEYSQESSSVFSKFTMKDAEGSIVDYIVTPKDVQWQEYGQNAISQLDSPISLANENWSDQIPNDGTYEGTTYKFAAYDDTSFYNFADKSADNYAWREDKLWLPSLTEIGYSEAIGIWNTSATQRQNSECSWLRSGIFSSMVYILETSGDDCIAMQTIDPRAVRPALHLNLTKAAVDSRIYVPSWVDFAADD